MLKKIYFSEFEKKISQIKSKKEIIIFYKKFFKNYIRLNKLYLFNSSVKFNYILDQIKKVLNKDKRPNNLYLVPFGIKDIINTKDLPTDFGLKSRKNFASGNNARVVDKIIGKSGIVFSKTNCAEFAVHYIENKKQRNPINKNFSAGTSSTGSAISVACGALPVSIGTQTAGSILRPSSYCGIYGFKPTYGAIDRTGILKTNDILDTVGILSSDLYGVKKTFKNLIDKNSDYPWTKNFNSDNSKKITLGYFDLNLDILNNFDEDVKYQYYSLVKKLKSKFNLRKISEVKELNELHNHHKILYDKSLSYYVKKIVPNSRKNILSSSLNKIIKSGEKIKLKDYKNSLRYVNKLRDKLDKNFFGVNFILLPTTASSAPKIKNYHMEKKDSCLMWTLLGNPSISLPVFKDKKNNLPFGLLISSKRYNDFELFEISKKILNLF